MLALSSSASAMTYVVKSSTDALRSSKQKVPLFGFGAASIMTPPLTNRNVVTITVRQGTTQRVVCST